ncbi:hypothetical protein PCURB6_37210 [Paenibacillus curdlanolyticus]|nr:hypothetical protein PCURB6_37210 [Paenibacillus curdlanolyticus]
MTMLEWIGVVNNEITFFKKQLRIVDKLWYILIPAEMNKAGKRNASLSNRLS